MKREFGRYELLEEIGRGGAGAVYRALDRELGRVVALKTLRDPEPGPAARERFLREARLAARLEHPHIVRIFEAGEHEGRPYYTMPLLEGAPLRSPLAPERAAALLAPVARAVAHAHAAGVVHRDLKPENILLCAGGPVVTDFGTARAEDDVRLTETGELLGTPAYMAPEQIAGRAHEAGPKADVYALGAILFELVTGRLPYEAESFLELSARVLHDPAPEAPGLDPGLGELIRRCLEKDPEARPSALEAADALERRAAFSRETAGRRPRAAALLAGAAALAGAALWAASPAPEDAPGDMIRIPAGVYMMGDPRLGRRPVALEEFWIDRFEAPARAQGYSYLDAAAWCLKQGKRLPTEEEWEAAAGGRLFPWGEAADPSRASCGGARGPNPRDRSPFGCQDMAGHLAEWTATPGEVVPESRVVRGGDWQSGLEGCTTWTRRELPLARRLPTLGVRCARSASPPAKASP
ncbi:MAG TPA: bifunctional serine/threonine-protein kinase/formylglycine-generating enzyme family protein [Planctomycetota bacterium]|nr:bifunctional serine/threonine-protein kinase/formylglycine-generating enzyme family protein [Planctomycetota bacterium]